MSNIKIKTDEGLFLTQVPAVHMTSSFGSDLSAALNTIDDNFKKIISLPFLKGDPGNSLSEAEFNIHDDSEIDDTLKDAVIAAVGTSQDQYTIGGASVFDSLSDNAYNPPIKFYRMRVEENGGASYKYVSQQMFLFVDARVPKLCKNMSTDDTDNFEDMSCGILFTGSVPVDQNGEEDFESASFTCSKFNVFPSLYFDKSAKRWCWKLNDFRTGVNAQGVDGLNGQDAAVQICSGTLGVGQIRIERDGVLQPSGESPKTGALTGVWFNDSEGRLNFTLGILKEYPEGSPSYYYIDYVESESAETEGSFDFRQMLSTITLAEHLDNIANSESAENPEVRGLYVPDSGDRVHMFWATLGNEREANLGVVSESQRIGTDSVDPDTSINTVLNSYYGSCIFPVAGVKIKKTDRVTLSEYRDYIATPSNSSVSNTVSQQVKDANSCINLGNRVIIGKDISDFDGGKICTSETEIRHSEGTVLLDRETVRIGNIFYPLESQNKTRVNVFPNTVNMFNTVADFRNSGIRLFDSSAVDGKMHIGQIIKNNQTEYIYDFRDEITNPQTPKVDNSRPRAVNYVPVKISGYNTVYRYQNDNGTGKICTNHRYPVEMTDSEIRDYAFLSGKTGYTAMLEFQGDYDHITHISPADRDSDRSILTSYDALWTKIGNVVDVKGKICFSVVPYTISSDGKYIPSTQNSKPITYGQFYNLIKNSGSKIAFPLPVVKKLSDSEFSVSVGNMIETPYIINKIDGSTSGSARPHNTIVSTPGLVYNDFYNGNASIHLFGDTQAPDGTEYGYLFSESNPSVFALNCTIGKSKSGGDRFWDFKTVPDCSIRSGSSNKYGPIKFAEGGAAGDDDEKFKTSPFEYVFGEQMTENNTQSVQNGIGLGGILYAMFTGDLAGALASTGTLSEAQEKRILKWVVESLTQKAVNLAVDISNYYIRHITFSFSYLLDDDTSYNGEPIDTDIWTQVSSNTGGMGISIHNSRTETESQTAQEMSSDSSR